MYNRRLFLSKTFGPFSKLSISTALSWLTNSGSGILLSSTINTPLLFLQKYGDLSNSDALGFGARRHQNCSGQHEEGQKGLFSSLYTRRSAYITGTLVVRMLTLRRCCLQEGDEEGIVDKDVGAPGGAGSHSVSLVSNMLVLSFCPQFSEALSADCLCPWLHPAIQRML